jgi:mono/diheme cytochrome c family protein
VTSRFVVAAALAALAACTPPASTDGAAPAAPPQPDIAAPAPESGPAAPNSPDTLTTTPAAAPAAPSPAASPPAPSAPPPEQTTAPAAATAAELASGRTAYTRTCAMCHGPKGEGTAMGVHLTTRDLAAIKDKIAKGTVKDGDKMPPMGGMLSGDELDDVSKFVAAGLPQ